MIADDIMLNFSKEFLQIDLMDKISKKEQISPDETQSGLKSIIPALLGAVAKKGATSEGATQLMDVLKNNVDLSGTELKENPDLVSKIFDNDVQPVLQRLKTQTGLESKKISRLMNITAWALMSRLGKKVKSEGLSTSGLMQYFNSEKNIFSHLGMASSEQVKTEAAVIPWKLITILSLTTIILWLWWASLK